MKKVIYTAIFGDYDNLHEPEVIPPGFDFICFTDCDFKKEDTVWDIRKVTPIYQDSTRNARKYKILAHRYLSEYDFSLWIDGNKIIVGDANNYINMLGDLSFATFDHMKCFDKRNCVYKEAQAIFDLGSNDSNNWKDSPPVIVKQMEKYQREDYPGNNGLVFTSNLVRMHNDEKCINAMEEWWTELKYGSKRDQLSFNYVAWKNNFKFNYLPGDGRDDGYVKQVIGHKK
tara:strand:- start:8236 stop:8922 length:687 start_codon:yes stop_codon:yes gene_type:complete